MDQVGILAGVTGMVQIGMVVIMDTIIGMVITTIITTTAIITAAEEEELPLVLTLQIAAMQITVIPITECLQISLMATEVVGFQVNRTREIPTAILELILQIVILLTDPQEPTQTRIIQPQETT